MLLGAQLYTVREYTKNLDDFADTLKRVADIGYTAVQVSGTCAYDATWLKERADDRAEMRHNPHQPSTELPPGPMPS